MEHAENLIKNNKKDIPTFKI